MFYAVQMSPALAIGGAFFFSKLQSKVRSQKPYVTIGVSVSAIVIYLFYFLAGFGM
jgi:hypothetical protein